MAHVSSGMRLSRNFIDHEFKCPCCSKVNMNSNLLYQLQKLRDSFGYPLKINSGYRCIAHNLSIGGAKNSQHLVGKAVDISTTGMTGAQKHQLLTLILRLGTFKGVGIASTFIHVDTRDAVTPIMWTY